MLQKLVMIDGDFSQLKQWEKRSYKAYKIEKIKGSILSSQPNQWKNLIMSHILKEDPNDLGASCIDIYLVAYIAENYGRGKERFFRYIKENGISEREGSAQAIWQVGKGDGVYLKVLNDDGSVKDWEFFKKWLQDEEVV